MFVFKYIYICVGCVGGGCLCVPIYVFIYVCVCVHALPPASILCGWKESVVEACHQKFKSKEPAWLLCNRCSTVLLNEERSSERDEQGPRKLFPAAWAPRQQMSQRMLFSQGPRFTGRGGGALRSTCFGTCKPLVGWDTGILSATSATSRAEQIGGVTHHRQDPLGLWSSAEERDETELAFCHLGWRFVGSGIIVMSREWGSHSVPSIHCSSTGLALVSE